MNYFRPLIPLLLSYAAGIALFGMIPEHAGARIFQIFFFAAVFIAIFSLARVIFHVFKKTGSFISPIVLMFAAGILSMSPWSPLFFPPGQAKPLIDAHVVRICGTVSGLSVKPSGRIVCVLDDILAAKQGSAEARIPGRVRAVFRGRLPKILPGDRIAVNGKIRGFKNFNNPGGFDYRRFMKFKNIWGSVYADAPKIKVISREKRGGYKSRVENFRAGVNYDINTACENFSTRLDKYFKLFGSYSKYFSFEKTAAVLSALVVGKKDRITPDLRDDFSRAGVSHLLAISGLHVGIVAAASFFFFKWLFSFSYYLLSRGATGRWAALFSGGIVLFYGLISGMSPSTQRAVLMVMVFLIAFFIRRDYDLLNTIAVAAFVILILFPPALFDISFKLSFAAVCAIFYGLYHRHGGRRPYIETGFLHGLFSRLRTFVFVSMCAIIGTAPLVMLYFNQVSIAGIFSNIILVPVIGFIVVPCGLFSVLLHILFPGAAKIGFELCAAVLSPCLSLVHAISRIPYASFKTITPSMIEIICFYMIVAGVFFLIGNRNKNKDVSDARSIILPGKIPGRRAAMAVVVLGLLVLCGDAFYWMRIRFYHDDLRTTIIDVGQGSSALVEFAGGKCMLIDGGGFYGNSVFDVGKNIVAPFLWHKRVLTVDTLVLSHPDADHLNGLVYVVKYFNVGQVIENGDPSDTDEYTEFKRIIGEKSIPCPDFSRVARKWSENGAEINILYPAETFVHALPKERENNRNNHCVVVKVSFKGRSILFPADIEVPAEKALVLSAGPGLLSTVLVSPHHGSRTSSTPGFLDNVRPETVIISARGNRPGLPSKTVLFRYAVRGYQVFRTDLNGAVLVTIGDAGMRIVPTIYDSVGP
ncbi:MAG: DNA internalization-related competence protein ComEC/Rec2 [Deltaproteobacteria bacterium]|nr:DNA internalization-related competence protein ComEC/Rec2 [Deltaproteobacteria bacterium]